MKAENTNYAYVMGSDLVRDGMYLELDVADASIEKGSPLAEVFYSDVDGSMTFTSWAPDLPLEVVEWLIQEARTRLPPIRSSSEPSSSPPS